MRKLLSAALIAAPPFAVLAEDAPVLAVYGASSGSLPPEYAWGTTVTIHADGTLTLKHCRGYETDGPACKTRRAEVSSEAIEAIRAAAKASGLAEKPARGADDIMVGGGSIGGAVWLDGQQLVLLSQPAAGDAERIATVLHAIEAAIPGRFDQFMTGE